ncbi:MAG: ATP cone domain-containing protein [Candidatus Hydrogenedentes bacterium]|nr:ATP cone domain-containing protein [Candidatus Hydrogenedentota bacterium]
MTGSGYEEREEFSDLFGPVSSPLGDELRVKKSNGHTEPFNLKKLTSSIKNAFLFAGEESSDSAYSLAVAIKNYLRSVYGAGSIVKSEELFKTTIHVLDDMGYSKVSRVYKEYERLKKLKNFVEERITEELNKNAGNEAILIEYDDLILHGANRLFEIFSEVCEDSNLVLDIAKRGKILKKVEDYLKLLVNPKIVPSASFIRELCVMVLIAEGYELTNKEKFISLDLEKILEILASANQDVPLTPKSSAFAIGDEVKKQLSKDYVFSKKVIEAGEKGKISLLHSPCFDKLDSVSIPMYSVWELIKGEEKYILSPDDFLECSLKISTEICDFFSSSVEWWGMNLILAPLLKGFEGSEYKDWLLRINKILCNNYHFSRNSFHYTIDWDLPEGVSQLSARGVKGNNLGTIYPNYLTDAREHFFNFLSIFAFPNKDINTTSHLIWRFDSESSEVPSLAVWSVVASVLENGKFPINFRFIPFSTLKIIPQVSLYKITIDLVNLYLVSENEQDFLSDFFDTVLIVTQAFEEYLCFLHKCKKIFGLTIWEKLLSRVYGKNATNLSFESFPVTVSLAGLRECVHLMSKEKKMDEIEFLRSVNNTLGKLKQIIYSVNKLKGLNIKIKMENDSILLRSMFKKTSFIYPNLLDYMENFSSKLGYESKILQFGTFEVEKLVHIFRMFLPLTRHFHYPLQIELSNDSSIDGRLLSEVMNCIFYETKKFSMGNRGEGVSFEIGLVP